MHHFNCIQTTLDVYTCPLPGDFNVPRGPILEKIKMAARRVGQKVIDWTKISSSLPEEVRGDFLAFRGRYEAAKVRMNSYPETADKIDWSSYKNKIMKENFVDSFQKQYDSLKIPYPKDISSVQLLEKQKEINAAAQEAIKQSKEQVLRLQQELDKTKSEKPYEEMSIDEYLADKPEIREKADRDTKNHIWYIAKE